MSVFEQSAAAKTSDKAPVSEQAPSSKTSPVSSEAELAPAPQKDAPASAGLANADQASKEERAKQVQQTWENTLGKWLGGPLAKIVLEHVSLEAMNGYVTEALSKVGPGIFKGMKGKVEGADDAALQTLSDGLTEVITGQVEKLVQSEKGQKVLGAIAGWVQDNPAWVMGIIGTALIGGAIAVYASNPDVDFTVPFGLGKDWKAEAGIDLGKLRDLTFQGASLAVANKAAGIKVKASVENDVEKNDAGEVTSTTRGAALDFSREKEGATNVVFALKGKVVETPDGLVAYSSNGKLDLVSPSGVKVSVSQDGKWSSSGAKDEAFSFSASGGKDVTGSFSTSLKNVTIVDQDGNIVDMSSRELKVAVGAKSAKFEASASQEVKDGKTTTTGEAKASVNGQLGAGSIFNASSHISVSEDKVTVKLDGDFKTEIGGRKVIMDGSYNTDGEVKGRIQVGEGDQYREVVGHKKGDVITFSTKSVFGDSSVEHSYTNANGQGVISTAANIKQGNQQLSVNSNSQGVANANFSTQSADGKWGGNAGVARDMAGQTSGNLGLNYKGERTTAGLTANTNGAFTANAQHTTADGRLSAQADFARTAEGQKSGNLGLKYSKDQLKASLDLGMEEAQTKLGLSASLEKPSGLMASGSIKFTDSQMTELGLKLGYRNPDEFKTAILEYKRSWSESNQQYSDRVDALLEYNLGRLYTRVQGGVEFQGGKVQQTRLDAGFGYAINDKWMAVAGTEFSSQRNPMGDAFNNSVKPYVGVQYGGVQITGHYDVSNKAVGVGIRIPFGRR